MYSDDTLEPGNHPGKDEFFLRVFELIGPIMFGPSSSHTAGACRVGRAVWQILGEDVREAHLELYGSFADRNGRGLNKALVSGLMGYDTDDDRLLHCMEHIKEKGIKLTWENVNLENAHMNTVRYTVKGDHRQVRVVGVSVGGGMIEVREINGAPVNFTGDYNTVILSCKNGQAMAAAVRELLKSEPGATVESSSSEDGKTQLVLIKSAKPLSEENKYKLSQLPEVIWMTGHRMFD